MSRRGYYNSAFRRWHWRVAYKQLIFMHGEPTPISEEYKYQRRSGYDLFNGHLLLAAGSKDNNFPDNLYSQAIELSKGLRLGTKVKGTSFESSG